MLSTTSLATKLAEDYPQFTFTPGEDFYWSPDSKTIYYQADSEDTSAFLHELAHGILGHSDYPRDITLIELERDAWTHAITVIAPRYDVTIDSAVADTALDSYRDWLHARSTCPNCHATGMQTKKDAYRCVACRVSWRVNEARICALRRYVVHS
jgi:hypothetical protein